MTYWLELLLVPEEWRLRADADQVSGIATLILAVASMALVGWAVL